MKNFVIVLFMICLVNLMYKSDFEVVVDKSSCTEKTEYDAFSKSFISSEVCSLVERRRK